MGKKVYCFFESPLSKPRMHNDPEKDMEGFESRDWKNDKYVRDLFDYDLEGLRQSEALIMLLPAGSSVHIEAGIAYGMGKECILIGKPEKAESLYLIFKKQYSTVEEFIKTL